MFKFNLGDEVKGKITGYKGVIRGRTEYLTGCNTYGIQNQKLDKDGTPRKWHWFDEEELILVKPGKIVLNPAFHDVDDTPYEKIKSKTKTPKKGGPLSNDQIPRD